MHGLSQAEESPEISNDGLEAGQGSRVMLPMRGIACWSGMHRLSQAEESPEASNDCLKAGAGIWVCGPALLHQVQILLVHAQGAPPQLLRGWDLRPSLPVHHLYHHLHQVWAGVREHPKAARQPRHQQATQMSHTG